jgi:hypothetical protein
VVNPPLECGGRRSVNEREREYRRAYRHPNLHRSPPLDFSLPETEHRAAGAFGQTLAIY